MIKISPSLLTADFGRLSEEVIRLDEAGADWIHCDVMDNVFVPNMSFGQSMIRAFREVTKKPLDVHLMLADPLKYIEEFASSGADIITVHPEASSGIHLHRVIDAVKRTGRKAGVAINPATHPDVLEYIYENIDLVLVMSVNPGYGGQSFIPQALRKISYIADRIVKLGLDIEIEVDGGVTVDNAGRICDAGATVLVAGSAVVDAPDRAEAIRKLKGL